MAYLKSILPKLSLIKKWARMLSGNSTLHVFQGEGKIYKTDAVYGYYNDFTQKVLLINNIDSKGLPFNRKANGDVVYFPIAIFQYGLGAYDLFLLGIDKEVNKKRFMNCVLWAIEHQHKNGSWDAFSMIGINPPYSSMAQGEGASLLLRAYMETNNDVYMNSAKKAIDCMLLPIDEGGTAEFKGDSEVFLYEFLGLPLVLNGWIFSIWGLYDYCLITKDPVYLEKLHKSINTLKMNLGKFNCYFWSKYNIKTKITSPFYHRLHIAQLNVMYQLFQEKVFKEYADLWQKYHHNLLYKFVAVFVKASQKIIVDKSHGEAIVE